MNGNLLSMDTFLFAVAVINYTTLFSFSQILSHRNFTIFKKWQSFFLFFLRAARDPGPMIYGAERMRKVSAGASSVPMDLFLLALFSCLAFSATIWLRP